jgi:hypothetical protein
MFTEVAEASQKPKASPSMPVFPETQGSRIELNAEYRPLPFWSLNDRLDADQMKRQLDLFQQAGWGGVSDSPCVRGMPQTWHESLVV